MKKIITFSLWGDNPFYTVGAIRNAELAKEFYPDWICRFYIGNSTPQDVIDKLDSFDNTEIVLMNTDEGWDGMFWRFYPVTDSDVDVMISRDVDSRITYREAAAVNEWLESGKTLHIMRDHPMHTEPIMGGMWGCRTKEMFSSIINAIYKPYPELPQPKDLKGVIRDWYGVEKIRTKSAPGDKDSIPLEKFNQHGIDQKFLRGIFYKTTFKDAWIQDSFPMYNCFSGRFDYQRYPEIKEQNTGFPTIRRGWNDFVGQIYFEDETPNEESAWYLKSRDMCIYMDTPDIKERPKDHYSMEEGQREW